MQCSINYSHHAVYYIPSTYLFYNWKFVLFDQCGLVEKQLIHQEPEKCLCPFPWLSFVGLCHAVVLWETIRDL